jgi:hypothetical protein
MSRKVVVTNLSGLRVEPTGIELATQRLRAWWNGDAILVQRYDEDLGVDVFCFVRGNVDEKDALKKAEQVLRDRRGRAKDDEPGA